jgi:hypothetical protein
MRIKTLGPNDDPAVKQISDLFTSRRGYFPSIMRAFSLKPTLLKQVAALTQATTFGASGLGRRREELISAYVSRLLNCRY